MKSIAYTHIITFIHHCFSGYRFKQLYMRLALILFVLILPASVAYGQFFENHRFGKNRVQYKSFSWSYITSANFEVYYYEGGAATAQLAARLAEENFEQVTDVVGFTPYSRIQLFIYNSHKELLQSNIGVNDQGYGTGGQTRFVRSDIEIAYNGSVKSFESSIKEGIADVLLFEMMYGGNLKEILQSAYLLNLPEWFMSGAAAYIATGWTAEMDAFISEEVLNKKSINPNSYSDEEAKLIGQSIWNYLAEAYSKQEVASVLNLTRIVRDEKASIRNTLGISYRDFLSRWQGFYRGNRTPLNDVLVAPSDSAILATNSKRAVVTNVVYSPDGRYLAYNENNRGRYKVKLIELRSGNVSTLYSGGYRVLSQSTDNEIPRLAWRTGRTLIIMAPKDGELRLWSHDISEGGSLTYVLFERDYRVFDDFQKVNSFTFDATGQTMLFSAAKNGYADIYSYDWRTRRTRQHTNDIADDLDPTFLPDGQIAFASNRPTDTVATSIQPEELPNIFNLYLLNPQNNALTQLTNSLNNNRKPEAVGKAIYHLSDQSGIWQLFRYEVESKLLSQVSNFEQNIEAFDVYEDQLTVLMNNRGRQQIYYLPNYGIEQPRFTAKTYRQQIIDYRYLQQQRQEREQEENPEPSVLDTADLAQQPQKEPVSDEPDTDNYQFDTFNENKRDSYIERYKNKIRQRLKSPQEIRLSAPEPYESRFTADNIVTSMRIDPLRGWGLQFEVQMTDLLENHKINAGLFGVNLLNDPSFYAEYVYLKRRIDFWGRYERHNLTVTPSVQSNDFSNKYTMHRIEGTASWPINITSRLQLSPVYTSTRQTSLSQLTLSDPDSTRNYIGYDAAFVYDNTISNGPNILEGTRGRIGYFHNYSLKGENAASFGNINLDVRHYQRVYRSLTLATRLSYGKFTGGGKKQYWLGGVDNALNYSFDDGGDPTEVNTNRTGSLPDQTDLFFSQFVTGMRGFNLNKWNGDSHLLFNVELRIPIVDILYQGTVSSNFFRNLQFVAFTDVGSAWTGLSPFNEENSLNTEIIRRGGFTAEVQNFKDPFLVGYGGGMRTMLLGYFARIDVAWGIEDRVLRSPKVYIAIGHDF